ncbi:sugar kinase [Pseudomonas sp. LP_7_YM]|uniref:sugar kinase n=1 Tax=Pseudomonas sp. LP_7_YM TaxID=2485137 RepID=UPI001060BA26|nr:sugar kinase [Pseudomonas sp. LP_7_YM]TDV72818.1 dehydrogluconokinase [Pseudomonas sp. LP_7_YM]
MSEIDILSFGETMTMLVAEQSGNLAAVRHFEKRIAGADSNVAIGLSRLGFKVAWLSRVGHDSMGRFVTDSLTAEGVDCSHVAIDPAHPTGFQFKSLELDGADPVVEYFRRGSAASHLSVNDIVPDLLKARHLHATGIPAALSDSCRELSQVLMTQMRDAGRSVSFDPNLRPSLWSSQALMIREVNHLASLAHWVMPGMAEGELLTGFDTPADIASFYLDLGVEAVVIKLGAKGAYYRTQLNEAFVPGVVVPKVIDTVGAGDGFAVGVISALLENLDFAQATGRGNWIGSQAVQSRGDMEGLPTLAELRAGQAQPAARRHSA